MDISSNCRDFYFCLYLYGKISLWETIKKRHGNESFAIGKLLVSVPLFVKAL